MSEVAKLLAGLLNDMTPGSYGIFLILGVLLVHFLREWRLTRKLSLDDRLARRDGYAAQVTSLQVENRALRGEMTEQRVEHAKEITGVRQEFADYRRLCEHETGQLRTELRGLNDHLAALERRNLVGQTEAVLALPPAEVPEHIRAAATRVEGYLKEADERAAGRVQE